MHFELPRVHIHSPKEFIKHYLMIVLSILTALGLEQWIVVVHHHHAAKTASAQIEAEIRTNLAEVHGARVQDVAQSKSLGQIRDSLIQDFKANTPDAVIVQHIQAETSANGFNLNMRWPTLRHEAWDVAVANQSASWIDSDRMRRYSAAYANQRDVSTAMGVDITLMMNGPRLIDTLTDLRAGSVQPRDFLHVVGQMAAMLSETQNNLGMLEKRLDDALSRDPSPAPKSTSAH